MGDENTRLQTTTEDMELVDILEANGEGLTCQRCHEARESTEALLSHLTLKHKAHLEHISPGDYPLLFRNETGYKCSICHFNVDCREKMRRHLIGHFRSELLHFNFGRPKKCVHCRDGSVVFTTTAHLVYHLAFSGHQKVPEMMGREAFERCLQWRSL